jgi:integrase
VPRRPNSRPWFRSDRGAWYIKIDGKQINLGPNKNEAETKLLRLLLEQKTGTPLPLATNLLVADVIDSFLDWCQKHKAPRTFEFYLEKTQSYQDWARAQTPSLRFLPATELRPIHLITWADSHDDWKPGMKRQAIMSVQRAFNWAEEVGIIGQSPVRHVKKPSIGKRENVITFAEYQAMLDASDSDELRDLLKVSWETGCRPQEIMRVEARHFDEPGRRWVFPKGESKGKKKIRIVYLPALSLEITKRLADEHPTGKLFRNSKGRPWNHLSVNCAMIRLAKRTGKKAALVDFRHSFVTRALKQGVDPITLGNLCGHADVTMIARTYSHLSQDAEHLAKALDKTNS